MRAKRVHSVPAVDGRWRQSKGTRIAGLCNHLRPKWRRVWSSSSVSTSSPMASSSSSSSSFRAGLLKLPAPLAKLFALFPLHTYPAIPLPDKHPITGPTLWIHPPSAPPDAHDLLSADVECLKWQAHLALRGVSEVQVRWDVVAEGALGERLPNLQLPLTKDKDGELLAAHNIPAWVDERLGPLGYLQGYRDVTTRDESHAWVALLEGDVQAALVRLLTSSQPGTCHNVYHLCFQTLSQPLPSFFYQTVLQLPASNAARPIETLLTPPPTPLTGISSLLRPYGSRLPIKSIQSRYREAIASLSECLGTDKWFLGSEYVTSLLRIVRLNSYIFIPSYPSMFYLQRPDSARCARLRVPLCLASQRRRAPCRSCAPSKLSHLGTAGLRNCPLGIYTAPDNGPAFVFESSSSNIHLMQMSIPDHLLNM